MLKLLISQKTEISGSYPLSDVLSGYILRDLQLEIFIYLEGKKKPGLFIDL